MYIIWGTSLTQNGFNLASTYVGVMPGLKLSERIHVHADRSVSLCSWDPLSVE